MPVIDTSVLLCGLAYPETESAEFLRSVIRGETVGLVSNAIERECSQVAGNKAPHLLPQIREFIRDYANYVMITDDDVARLSAEPSDKNDSHLVAAALASGEQFIYTLDLKLFNHKLRTLSQQYGVQLQFPSFQAYLRNPLENIHDLPAYKPTITSSRGSVTLTITTTWDSRERSHIDKRWYVLDAEGIFGLWYETPRQAFRFLPYPLGNDYMRVIRKSFHDRQSIRFTVTFDHSKGFGVYIDSEERHCNKGWRIIMDSRDINIGHSIHKVDHFNSYYRGIRAFGECLPQRVVRIMHAFDLVSVSDKDLEITESNRWLLYRC